MYLLWLTSTAALLGCVMMGLALLASKMGGLIQATATLHNMIAGPVIGMFLVGTCLPICGKKSVLAGLCVSMVNITCLPMWGKRSVLAGLGVSLVNITCLPMCGKRSVLAGLGVSLVNITCLTMCGKRSVLAGLAYH